MSPPFPPASPENDVDETVSDSDTEGEQYGDYSTRMDELFSDQNDDDGSETSGASHSRSQSVKVTGTSYRDQLRDVLGSEHSEAGDFDEDEEAEEQEVERSLTHEPMDSLQLDHLTVPRTHESALSDTPSSARSATFSPNQLGSLLPGTPTMKLSKPFLHPTISRLRSSPSQPLSRIPSTTTIHSRSHEFSPPESSHISALSQDEALRNGHTEREVFHWTHLSTISNFLLAQNNSKVTSLLGSPNIGAPMVLAANGLICIGTQSGNIAVFDFKQNLKCICGTEVADKSVGAVTSLALSHDHTYVASGHASGHIRVFDLNKPGTPARVVVPTTAAAVKEGRREGHFIDTPITSIGFIAGRHTAIVTSDDTGLAFYHSLGKVLFVDATDVIRILGKYPDDITPDTLPGPSNGLPTPFRKRRERKSNTIISMSPLPLGTCPHKTDAYNIIALLTPMKLVVVGLKPRPTTWYRRNRGQDDTGSNQHKWKGSMAWFPCVDASTGRPLPKNYVGEKSEVTPTKPMLVYTWAETLNLIKVSERKVMQPTKNAKTGKISQVEVGTIVIEEASKWATDEVILAVEWLNLNQIIVVTPTSLQVHDVNSRKMIERSPFDATTLVTPSLGQTSSGAMSYSDSVSDIAHSVRVYKNKIFLLGRQDMQVGTLLTWADRILSFVQDGDFLNAIDLTRSYYIGEATGNRNGLPDDPQSLKDVVGEKMRDLMVASARYAFSEDRMTDGTHITPDGRGVDRTSLFEDLVSTCARACIALRDFYFLFEDLFQCYDGSGIARIYLTQLEPFILDNSVPEVPPRITQRIVGMHAEDERPDLAERVIWHIDPECLDINQAIGLCQAHHLYDALIYVYTRALKDYVSPIVELIGLIRKVQQFRHDRAQGGGDPAAEEEAEAAIEPYVVNAYKIYPYLADVLSGLTYPSEEPLSPEEAIQAKNDVYTFLFFGRSSVWPAGEGGKLVLTSDEEGGVEPTYPYLRLLLRFDAESLLNSLDLAFEDSYLNDEKRGVSRLVIVKVLLEILTSSDLSPSDTMFVNIFIARNVPKYPQFIQIAPSALHNILISLAEYPDPGSREDRQLAAEFLLSAYTPHEGDRILKLFEQAGFYRILRSWHRQERQWPPLIRAFLKDPELRALEVISSIEDVLVVAETANQGVLPAELLTTVEESLSALLHASVTSTASLLDKHTPLLHTSALETLGEEADDKRFEYLRYLLGLPAQDAEPSTKRKPSSHIPQPLRQLYVSLQCKIDPANLIPSLSQFSTDFFDWEDALKVCEEEKVYPAVVWGLNWNGDPRGALHKGETFQRDLTASILENLSTTSGSAQFLEKILSVAHRGIDVCLQHSRASSSPVHDVLEDMWFELLRSQIECVQSVSTYYSHAHSQAEGGETLSTLRQLVQETFTALVSVGSARQISFPRLFKRLVDSATQASKETHYTEFRMILTGMLESYRSEGDLLTITKHLLDRDVFDTVEELTRARLKGWTLPLQQVGCTLCGKSLLFTKGAGEGQGVAISRAGVVYHDSCFTGTV